MKDNTVITSAIEDLLNSYSALNNVTVERNTRINTYSGNTPWIGVYSGKYIINPVTLGRHSGDCRTWKQEIRPSIIVQANNLFNDGTQASEELEKLIMDIIDAISSTNNTELNFGLSGVRLIGIDTEYSYSLMDGDESGDLFFPQAEIILTLEVR